MKTFNVKKILIPIDFSETAMLALEHGVFMASLFKADIILLHCVKPNWTTLAAENTPMPTYTIQYQEDLASEQLEKIADKVRKEQAVNVETFCETGRVCPVILEAADKHKADLIMMGTHGTSGFEERFIGSNAYRVVNGANCPVITVQTHSIRKGFKDIVLPIDNSFYSRQKVNHAIELAHHYGSRIHILGLTHSNEPAEINKLKIKLDQTEEYLDKNGLICSKQIKHGTNYAKVAMEYADDIRADLIMIMTEWEEDLTGLFIGPFARQIVNHSKIPVMSIRPDVKSELVEPSISWMVQH